MLNTHFKTICVFAQILTDYCWVGARALLLAFSESLLRNCFACNWVFKGTLMNIVSLYVPCSYVCSTLWAFSRFQQLVALLSRFEGGGFWAKWHFARQKQNHLTASWLFLEICAGMQFSNKGRERCWPSYLHVPSHFREVVPPVMFSTSMVWASYQQI